jgi:LysM repeat protein
MNSLRQVILGILAALLSAAIILGGLSMAMTEGSRQIAQAPSPTNEPTLVPGAPSPTPAPTAFPSPASNCPIPKGWIAITVQSGDTLQSLADTYKTTAENLAIGNCLPNANVALHPGSQLAVPPLPPTNTPTRAAPTPTKTTTETLLPTYTPIACGHPYWWIIYIVKSGDNLYRIAILFQTTVNELIIGNCLPSDQIYAGQRLWVPNNPTITPESSKTSTPTRTLTPEKPPSDTPTPGTPSPATSTPTPSDTPLPTQTKILPTPSETPEPEPPTPTPDIVTAPAPPPTLSSTELPPG